MSKLTGLRAIFRKISIYMGFHALTLARSFGRFKKTRVTDLVVIEGILISQSYVDELLMSVVLPFVVQEPVPVLVRSRMTMPEYISPESENFTKTMMCALTGHCAHQTRIQLNMCRTFLYRVFNA